MEPLDEHDLHGFEHHLTEIQNYLDNFTEESATKNMAAYKGFLATVLLAVSFCVVLLKRKVNLKKTEPLCGTVV